MAGNGQSRGLVAGCMDLDLMFQRVVVEIVYNGTKLDIILFPLSWKEILAVRDTLVEMTYAGSIQEQTPSPAEGRIS